MSSGCHSDNDRLAYDDRRVTKVAADIRHVDPHGYNI